MITHIGNTIINTKRFFNPKNIIIFARNRHGKNHNPYTVVVGKPLIGKNTLNNPLRRLNSAVCNTNALIASKINNKAAKA